MTSAWVRELNRQAVHGSERAHLAVQRLTHLIGSPAGLLHPALLAGAVHSRIGRRRRPAPRPPALDMLAVIEDPVPSQVGAEQARVAAATRPV
ncbi:hypothetical protein [Nakamurella sp.]|uniref:hypothetical protein n=1 Tax=Nakamurella sp. TaxID=1869182 RepID=UPI003784D994